MQLYTVLYQYIREWEFLLYKYYAKHAIPFLVSYYNINVETTVWDNEYLDGGYYERIGDLSGLRWNKILLLPVFFIEEMTAPFEGAEEGLIKRQETNIVIPSEYGITPYASDLVKVEQFVLRPTNDVYPLYKVTGIEKSANTDVTFWRLHLILQESETENEAAQQVSKTLVFFDYTKKIYNLEDAEYLTKMLEKDLKLSRLLRQEYDHNSGLYFIE